MKRSRNRIKNTVLCAALCMALCAQGILPVHAITTKFMVPTISNAFTPDNCLYKSPNLNLVVCKWGYGLTADVLNTSNMDTLIGELHANSSPSKYKKAILGIYTEGAGLSDANVADIRNAGWTDVELYYETYLVGGNAPSGAMLPSVTKSSDEDVLAVLAGAGITDKIALVEVSGVTMTRTNFILYEKEFSFLKGKTLHSYKFIPDLKVFVPIPESYFGSYAANFLELYDLQIAEPDVNGLYVTLAQSLPEELVASADQLPALRDALTPPVPEVKVVANREDTVQWTFSSGQEPEGFTPEAVVAPAGKTEVSVDFAYSGALPEGTQVTVQIPHEEVAYSDGVILYLYYCDPHTQMREFVSQGTYQDQQVTFQIEHCSEYVITSEDHGSSYQPEPEPEPEPTPIQPDSPTTDSSTPQEPEQPQAKTSSFPIWPVLGLACLAIGAVSLILYKKRK